MKKYVILSVIFALTACGGDGGGILPSKPEDVSHYPKVPWKGVKVGKSYKINGKWYSPRFDPDYEEVGVASWYGPGFHGRKTANGERYDQNAYTAAHTTLPLPSIVRVTNLQNGKAMNLRVNDRGPFHGGRIIDLSKAAAQKLDVLNGGVARVKVTYLHAETERYVTSKGKSGFPIAYTKNFADYQTANASEAMPAKLIQQDIKNMPMESQGTQIAAPLKGIEIADLPDISAKQVQQMDADWLVQVASYADTTNAQNLMTKLRPMGEPLVQTVDVKGTPFYRVLLKPTAEQSNQTQMLSLLEENFGISDAKVIKR